MSGGSFDYVYHHINFFIDDLETKIKNNKKKDEWGYCPNYSDETITKLKEILELCKKTSNLMKATEWLYSGDTGEDDWLEDL